MLFDDENDKLCVNTSRIFFARPKTLLSKRVLFFVFVFVFLCVFFGGCGGVCVRGGGILVFNIFTYANVFVS